MATANPISEDNFVLKLNQVKENVVAKFREISQHLDERKNELLRQINTILVSYQTYKREYQTANEKKEDLETTELFHQNLLPNSPNKSMHNNVIALINTELEAIVTPKQPKLVTFVCEKQKLLTEVNMLCKLVERVSEIDYTSKIQSIISVCDKGTGNEQLNSPYGVTVDPNTVYQLDGKFVSRMGSEGSGELQFKHPVCAPLPPGKPESPPSGDPDIVTRPFYHPIRRAQAEEMLKTRASHGDFVVRVATREGCYSLSVMAPDKIKHFKIEKNDKGEYSIGQRVFPSFQELYEHYRNNPILTATNGDKYCLKNGLSSN